MSAVQGNSPNNRSRGYAGQPTPLAELIQPVLPGFEGQAVSYTLQQAPRQAKARRQRRPSPLSIKPRPDQLSFPYPA